MFKTRNSDNIFFPKVREHLKKSRRFAKGSTDAERLFSCIRRIRSWILNTMATERLSDLVVIAMNENAVTIKRSVVCEKFVAPHPRRITASSLLAD